MLCFRPSSYETCPSEVKTWWRVSIEDAALWGDDKPWFFAQETKRMCQFCLCTSLFCFFSPPFIMAVSGKHTRVWCHKLKSLSTRRWLGWVLPVKDSSPSIWRTSTQVSQWRKAHLKTLQVKRRSHQHHKLERVVTLACPHRLVSLTCSSFVTFWISWLFLVCRSTCILASFFFLKKNKTYYKWTSATFAASIVYKISHHSDCMFCMLARLFLHSVTYTNIYIYSLAPALDWSRQ